MSEKQDFQHESLEDRESIARYFAALQECLSKGQLRADNGTESMELQLEGMIRLQLQITQSEHSAKLNLNLHWNTQESPVSGALRLSAEQS